MSDRSPGADSNDQASRENHSSNIEKGSASHLFSLAFRYGLRRIACRWMEQDRSVRRNAKNYRAGRKFERRPQQERVFESILVIAQPEQRFHSSIGKLGGNLEGRAFRCSSRVQAIQENRLIEVQLAAHSNSVSRSVRLINGIRR